MGKGKVETVLSNDGKTRLKGKVGSHSTVVKEAKAPTTNINKVKFTKETVEESAYDAQWNVLLAKQRIHSIESLLAGSPYKRGGFVYPDYIAFLEYSYPTVLKNLKGAEKDLKSYADGKYTGPYNLTSLEQRVSDCKFELEYWHSIQKEAPSIIARGDEALKEAKKSYAKFKKIARTLEQKQNRKIISTIYC